MSSTNKALVERALTELFQQKNLEAIDRYFAPDYRQHNPFVANGPEGLRAFAGQAIVHNPGFSAGSTHLLEDGELVAVRCRYTGFGERAHVGFDLFRVRDGSIAEHWDCLQEDPHESEAHFFAAAAEPGAGDTEATRTLVHAFVNQVLIGLDFDRQDEFISLEPATSSLQEACSRASSRRYTRLHRMIVEGDLALTQAEGTLDGRPHALYDLFQVRDGKIATHWGVVQEVTEVTVSGLGFF